MTRPTTSALRRALLAATTLLLSTPMLAAEDAALVILSLWAVFTDSQDNYENATQGSAQAADSRAPHRRSLAVRRRSPARGCPKAPRADLRFSAYGA